MYVNIQKCCLQAHKVTLMILPLEPIAYIVVSMCIGHNRLKTLRACQYYSSRIVDSVGNVINVSCLSMVSMYMKSEKSLLLG